MILPDANTPLPAKVPYASPAVRLYARELGVDFAASTEVPATQAGTVGSG